MNDTPDWIAHEKKRRFGSVLDLGREVDRAAGVVHVFVDDPNLGGPSPG